MMEEDGVMKTNYGAMKASDDKVQQGGGIFGRWFHQVFCGKTRLLDALCESSCPLWAGIRE